MSPREIISTIRQGVLTHTFKLILTLSWFFFKVMAIWKLCLFPVLSYCCCNSGSRKLWSTKRKMQRNLFHKVAASHFCWSHFLSWFWTWINLPFEKGEVRKSTKAETSRVILCKWCFCMAGRQVPLEKGPCGGPNIEVIDPKSGSTISSGTGDETNAFPSTITPIHLSFLQPTSMTL